MAIMEMKIECPELPVWLEPADINIRDGNHEQVSPHLRELLTLYRRATTHNEECAEELAVRYETGDLPCGSCLNMASIWHAYAAELGSTKSALRLARLLLWTTAERDHVTRAAEMAKKTISNALRRFYPDHSDLSSAASAARLLLDGKVDQEGLELIGDLLEHNKFVEHPDYAVISDCVRLIQCQRGDVSLSLQIASGKITEDPEFKAGMYRCLERPLPLVGLPDADFVKGVLDLEFPWFAAVNEQIYRQLVVQQYSQVPVFRLRPLLLAGPPGVGKTTWAKRLSDLCNVPFRSVMAGGGADSMFLRGTPRGYSSARPGAVVQAMATEGIANPLFLVDELEKASSDSRNGRIWDVLLQLLEPATASIYLDECLQVPCDLSRVSWIATVNEIGQLPRPLLERFTVVVVQAPGEEHFQVLVDGVIRTFAKELGLDFRMLPSLDNNDLDVLRRCNGPREINRTTRMMIEKRLVDDRRLTRRN